MWTSGFQPTRLWRSKLCPNGLQRWMFPRDPSRSLDRKTFPMNYALVREGSYSLFNDVNARDSYTRASRTTAPEKGNANCTVNYWTDCVKAHQPSCAVDVGEPTVISSYNNNNMDVSLVCQETLNIAQDCQDLGSWLTGTQNRAQDRQDLSSLVMFPGNNFERARNRPGSPRKHLESYVVLFKL